MSRPRSDGTPARAPERRALNDRFVRTVKPDPTRRTLYWDEVQSGLALAVEPSGFRSYKMVYRHAGRPRWYNVGDARKLGLKDARDIVRNLYADVVKGVDPAAARKAVRKAGTFEDLATRYLNEHAKRKNRSWEQAEWLIDRHVLPGWKHRWAADIRRSDVRQMFRELTEGSGPILANQALAATSAIFSWALREEILDLAGNPCTGIERNPVRKRERFLNEKELKEVWPHFESADEAGRVLRAIVLCGQRPGEVLAMRWEDVDGSWWNIPAEAYKARRAHRVYLSEAVLTLMGKARAKGRVFAVSDRVVQNTARDIWSALEIPAFRPHDLRATCASHLSSMGVPRDTISRVLGHAEAGSVTAGYVRHGYDAEKQRAMTAWARRLEAIVTGTGAGKVVALR